MARSRNARRATVRVAAGVFRGRRLRYPPVGVRPTMQRTKESVFDALAARVPGAVFADLFAGAGGVGIEALSRGAAFVHFVERSRDALAALAANLADLGLDPARYRIHDGDVAAVLDTDALADPPPTLVWADPPYGDKRDVEPPGGGALETVLAILGGSAYPGVRLVVVEHRAGRPPAAAGRLRVERVRRTGETAVTFLVRTEECAP